MNETGSHSTRVAIVGTGHVVATFASSLLLRWLAAEIVLIDEIRAKAEGDAMDLNHAVSFAHPTRVRAGDYSDCSGAIVTVMAAGTAQKPGETRLDLLKNNARDLSPDRMEGYYRISDVSLSLPSVINHGGVERVPRLELNDHEIEALQPLCGGVKANFARLNLAERNASQY